MGVHRTRRDAYDHFLPKGINPFSSVNSEISPQCVTSAIPATSCRKILSAVRPQERAGKAFYSYADVSPGITTSVTLKTKDITKLLPNEIDLQITAPGRVEEVETLKEVFGIEERYKDKLCGKNGGMAWL
jgi:hypothetical protein